MGLLNKLFIRLGFIIIATSIPIYAYADIVWEEWVAVFDSPLGYRAESTDIAVDGDGNVYVTGFASTEGGYETHDFCTIKYDSDGNELWFATYDGPADRSDDNDGAFAIVLDNDYNVYVTGALDGGHDFWYSECCTIKYDTDGNEIWIRTFGGVDVWGNDIAIDNEGNVYVAGTANAWGTLTDVFLIKYDVDGNELWFARHDGPDSGSDAGTALILDDYGNIYVTGAVETAPYPDYNNSFCTIKYNSDGEEQWFAYYNPGPDETRALDIGLDDNGNVFVTGGDIPENAATVKYDNDGNDIWAIEYDYDNMSDNYLAIGIYGNIYVTGTTSDGSDVNYKTVKYDNDGNEIWVREYNGPSEGLDIPRSVAVDDSGGIYVGGRSKNDLGPDYCCVVKYDTEGNERWVGRSEAEGTYHFEGMAIDALVDNVHIYTTGWDQYSSDDIRTIKFGQLLNEPPADFDIMAPPDGSTVTEPVTVDWEDSADADGDTITYDVWYTADPSFDPHDEVNELTDSTYTFPEGVLTQGETYYWKVLAWDGYEGTWSGPDDYWSFTVENEPPGDFDLTSPPDGSTVTEPVILDWEDSIDPGRSLAVGAGSSRAATDTGLSESTRSITYDVWYAADPSFDPHDEVNELTDSTYTFPEGTFSDGTTYYWKVRAWDGFDATWSGPDPYWSFTVDNELDVPVTSFSAESSRNGIEVTWECADPGVGFNLYRFEEATGVRTKLREIINAELITGESPYAYLDAEVSDGVTYSYWLEAIDVGGASDTFGPVRCTAGTFVPTAYALYQSRPNPARGAAVIAFDLPEYAKVTLTIYDLSGRKVMTVVDEKLPTGVYERSVSGLPPGVYVYRLEAGEFVGVRKMVVVE